MSTLLEAGFTVSRLGVDDVEVICDYIEEAFRLGGGLVGFGRRTAR